MSVLVDIIDGSSLTINKEGLSKRRIAIVDGVTGTGAEREWQAINTSGVPGFGSALGSGLPLSLMLVTEITAEPAKNSQSIYHVHLTYTTSKDVNTANPGLGTFSFESSLAQVTSTHDRNGDPVVVEYNGVEQGVDFSDTRVEANLVIVRVEAGISPQDLIDAYLGKVNSRTWQRKPKGYWLCVGIRGESKDDGQTWTITYQFDLAPNNIIGKDSLGVVRRKNIAWNPVVYYSNAETGRPPADLVFDVGFKEVDALGTADFNRLNF